MSLFKQPVSSFDHKKFVSPSAPTVLSSQRENKEEKVSGKWKSDRIEKLQRFVPKVESPFIIPCSIEATKTETESHFRLFYSTHENFTTEVKLISEKVKMTLTDFINQENGQLKEDEVNMILSQIWVGMNHLRNIAKSIKAHCLHPSNISITIEMNNEYRFIKAKIIDYLFSISSKNYPDDMKMYIHPEILQQISQNKLITTKTGDLYSFACLVSYLYSGRLPFVENATIQTIFESKNFNHISIPDIPFPHVKEIIESILLRNEPWTNMLSKPFIIKIISMANESLSHDMFEYEKSLGSGGYGTVYLVSTGEKMNENDEIRLFALKESFSFPQVISEIGFMKICKHPNVVKMYGAYQYHERFILNKYNHYQQTNKKKFEEVKKRIKFEISEDDLDRCRNGYPSRFEFNEGTLFSFIWMEYCAGGSLNDYAEKCRNKDKDFHFSQPFIRHVVKETLNGLDYLHNKLHLFHGDLKPANIFLQYQPNDINPFPTIKIGDFGISQHIPDCSFIKRKKGTQLYNTQEIKNDNSNSSINDCIFVKRNIGTEIYDAPEIINENKASLISDIWSLGIVYYELKTNELPTERETQIINEIIPYASRMKQETYLNSKRKNIPTTVYQDTGIIYYKYEWEDDQSLLVLVKCMLVKDPYKRIFWDDIKQTTIFKELFKENKLNESFSF